MEWPKIGCTADYIVEKIGRQLVRQHQLCNYISRLPDNTPLPASIDPAAAADGLNYRDDYLYSMATEILRGLLVGYLALFDKADILHGMSVNYIASLPNKDFRNWLESLTPGIVHPFE